MDDADPEYMFLDLKELPNQGAQAIIAALIQCLHDYGFSDSYLQQHIVAFASDEASVMLGRKAGVGTLLKNNFS